MTSLGRITLWSAFVAFALATVGCAPYGGHYGGRIWHTYDNDWDGDHDRDRDHRRPKERDRDDRHKRDDRRDDDRHKRDNDRDRDPAPDRYGGRRSEATPVERTALPSPTVTRRTSRVTVGAPSRDDSSRRRAASSSRPSPPPKKQSRSEDKDDEDDKPSKPERRPKGTRGK